jgi:hypothetical protein
VVNEVGDPVLSVQGLQVGGRIRTVWRDGTAWSRVEETEKALDAKGHTSRARTSD